MDLRRNLEGTSSRISSQSIATIGVRGVKSVPITTSEGRIDKKSLRLGLDAVLALLADDGR